MVGSYIKEKVKKYLDEGIAKNEIAICLIRDSVKDQNLQRELLSTTATYVTKKIIGELKEEGYKPKNRKAIK